MKSIIPIFLIAIFTFFQNSTFGQGETCVTADIISSTETYTANGPGSGNGCFNCNLASHADWYQFTPINNGIININSCYGGADTRFWVYVGSCGSLTLLGGNDDACPYVNGSSPWASEILNIPVSAGQTYFIEWDNRWSTAGFNFNFEYLCDPISGVYTENFDGGTNLPGCWTQDASETLDWSFISGATPTIGTGPHGDSTNSGSGNYAYVESSAASAGDTAILYLPMIDITNLTNPALSFFYHMDGVEMGILQVQAEIPNGSGNWITLWNLQGSQGTIWKEGGVNLAGVGTIARLRFVGIVGNGDKSDMAIDGITIQDTTLNCDIFVYPDNAVGVNTSNATATTVDLTWGYPGTAWVLEYGTTGFTPTNGTTINAATNTATLTSLTPNALYDVYFTIFCTPNDTIIGPLTFEFDPPCLSYPTPYSSSFELGFLDECWDQSKTDDFDWTIQTGGTASGGTGPNEAWDGNFYAYTESSTPILAGETAILISPEIDLSGLTQPEVSFAYHMYGIDMGSLSLELETGGNIDTLWQEDGNQGNQWQTAYIDLSNYTNQIVTFYIKGIRGIGPTSDMAIDSFIVKEVTPCPNPNSIALSNISTSAVDISWASIGNPTGFNIEYVISGNPQGNGTIVPVTSNPTTITGLISNTTYDIYLQEICNSATSSWIGPVTFSTDCGIINTDYTDGFENNGLLNLCWVQEDILDDFDWSIGYTGIHSPNTGPLQSHEGQYYLYIESSTPQDSGDIAILYSKNIDLNAFSNPTLSFYYHMFGGNSMGNLMIDIESPTNSGNWTNLATYIGSQQAIQLSPFLFEEIDLSNFSGTCRLRLVGEIGTFDNTISPQGAWQSDIAIDAVRIFDKNNKDLEVVDIFVPISLCNLGNNESIGVAVKNKGLDPQSNFDLGFSINGGSLVTQTYSGTLQPDSILNFYFNNNANFSTDGTYQVTVFSLLNGDQNVTNDTMESSVTNQPEINSFPYEMSWENSQNGWVATGDWELGVPNGSLINSAFNGINAWVTNLDGNYQNSTISTLTSPCFDFTGYAGTPTLRGAVWYDIESDWDGAYVEVSADGISWSRLGTVGDGINWYNTTNTNSGSIQGDVWSGHQNDGTGDWLDFSLPLVGLNTLSSLQIRFVMASEGSIHYEGLALDKFKIDGICTLGLNFNTTSESSFNAIDGTATVTPTLGVPPFTYNWSNGSTDSTAVNLSGGVLYTVTVSDNNGCVETLDIMINTVGTELISDLEQIHIFPNPAQNVVNIDLEFEDFQSEVSIILINTIGKQQKRITLNNIRQTNQLIDLQGLSSGFYVLQVQTPKGSITKPLIIINK